MANKNSKQRNEARRLKIARARKTIKAHNEKNGRG